MTAAFVARDTEALRVRLWAERTARAMADHHPQQRQARARWVECNPDIWRMR